MTELDARLFRALHDLLSSRSESVTLMLALSFLGSGWSMIALAPLLVQKRTRAFAAALVATLSAVAVLVFAGKRLFARVRPYRCLDGIQCFVVEAPKDYSFPSGHAAGSFGCAVFLATVLLADPRRRSRGRWGGAAALVSLAAGIAASRIGLGVHFPGDVLAGALLGGTCGFVGARLYLKRSPASPAPLAPT